MEIINIKKVSKNLIFDFKATLYELEHEMKYHTNRHPFDYYAFLYEEMPESFKRRKPTFYKLTAYHLDRIINENFQQMEKYNNVINDEIHYEEEQVQKAMIRIEELNDVTAFAEKFRSLILRCLKND